MSPRTSTRFQFSPVYTDGVQGSIDSVVAAMTPTSPSAMMRSNVVSAEYASALGKDFFGAKVKAIEAARLIRNDVITPELASALGKEFFNRDFNVVKNDDFATIFVDPSPKYRDYSSKYSPFDKLPSSLFDKDINHIDIAPFGYQTGTSVVQTYEGCVSVTPTSVHMTRTSSSETSASSVSIQTPEDRDYTFLQAIEQSEVSQKVDNSAHSFLLAGEHGLPADHFYDAVEIHPSDRLLPASLSSTAPEDLAAPNAFNEDVHQHAPTLVETVTSTTIYYDAYEHLADEIVAPETIAPATVVPLSQTITSINVYYNAGEQVPDEAVVPDTLQSRAIELPQPTTALPEAVTSRSVYYDAYQHLPSETVVPETLSSSLQSSRSLASYLSNDSEAGEQWTAVDEIEQVEVVVKEKRWRTKLSVPWMKIWRGRKSAKKACPSAPHLASPARFEDPSSSFGSLVIINRHDAEGDVKGGGLGVLKEKKVGRVRGFVLKIVKGARRS